jgi:ADP-ribosylglycohydrolase
MSSNTSTKVFWDKFDSVTRKDSIRGAFIAHALGDALGAPYEFKADAKRKYKGVMELEPRIFNPYTKKFRAGVAGQVTDDTEMTSVMTCSIVETVSRGGPFRDDYPKIAVMNYLRWANPPAFQGRNTRSLFSRIKTYDGYLKRVEKAESLSPTGMIESQSNGPLMRAFPWIFLRQGKRWMKYDVELTNPHPLVLDVCRSYVRLVRWLLKGGDPDEARAYLKKKCMTKELKEYLSDPKLHLDLKAKEFRGQKKGWVVFPLIYALWTLQRFKMKASSLEKIADDIINHQRGCDSDTVLAITFSIYGAVLGEKELLKSSFVRANLEVMENADLSQGDFPRPDYLTFVRMRESLEKFVKLE